MRVTRRRSVWMAVALVIGGAGSSVGAGEPRRAVLGVESEPSGALVSVHEQPPAASYGERVVAGETPVTRNLDFGRQRRLWLELEHRGYAAKVVEVTPASGHVSVELEPVVGVSEVPSIGSVVVVEPAMEAIERRFASEATSDELSALLADALQDAAVEELRGHIVVRPAGPSAQVSMRSIWRELRTAARRLDPIRLSYLSVAPCLESRAALEAVRQLGELSGADAVLLVSGQQNRETGGMKAGKIGVLVAGTAASYASAYGRAVANGNDLFTYTAYLPTSADGLAVTAILVHCASGEIVWMNMGVWPPIARNDPDRVRAVVSDLLARFPAPVNRSEQQEEGS